MKISLIVLSSDLLLRRNKRESEFLWSVDDYNALNLNP